jgi:hypothetical protein
MLLRVMPVAIGLVLGASAQSTAPSPAVLQQSLQIGAVRQSVEAQGMEVQVSNISSQPVTAFCISLQWQFASGEQKPDGLCRDLASGLALDSLTTGSRRGSNLTFRPGEIQTLVFPNPRASDGSPAILATAAATMVIFEDRTSLGDQQQSRSVLDARKAKSQEMGELVRRMRLIQASPDRASAMKSQLDDVGSLMTRPKSNPADVQAYRRLQRNLQDRQGLVEFPQLLDERLQLDIAQSNYLAEHSVLKQGGGK